MRLRELMECLTATLWITFDEDPNDTQAEVEVMVNVTSGECGDADVLADWLLDSDVHLVRCEKGVCYVSMWKRPEVAA